MFQFAKTLKNEVESASFTGLTSTNAVIETTKGDVATYHEFSMTSQQDDNPKYGDLTIESHILNPMFEKGKWVGGESNKIVGAGLQYTVPVTPGVNVAVGGGYKCANQQPGRLCR